MSEEVNYPVSCRAHWTVLGEIFQCTLTHMELNTHANPVAHQQAMPRLLCPVVAKLHGYSYVSFCSFSSGGLNYLEQGGKCSLE